MTDLSYNPEQLVVLIVDDHDPIRKALKRLLTQMHFNDVIETFDGKDAIQILDDRPVDLILCDIYMRNIDGFGVLRYVRSRDAGSDIPFIMISGEAEREDIVKAVDLGSDDYAIKPFHASDIEKKIVTVLNKFHSPTPLLRLLRLGERLLLLKQYTDAFGTFNEAHKLDPNSMRARHGKAVALQHLKRTNEAIQILNASIEVNQTYYKNYATLANLHLAKNETTEAICWLKLELELNPKQPERQVLLAKLLQAENDAMGAIQHYREALKENTRHLEALMGMGHAHAAAENIEKAVYYFKRARRYHPSNTKSLETVVRLCLDVGEQKKAELILRDEVRAHPERLDAEILLAKLYASTEQLELALESVDHVLTAEEDHLQALRMKAVLETKLKHFEVAVAVFEHVLELDDSIGSLINLGDAKLAHGQIEKAESVFRQALVMDNKNPKVLFRLANICMKMDQFTKAFVLYHKLSALGQLSEKVQEEMKYCLVEIRRRRIRPTRASGNGGGSVSEAS